MEKKLQVRDLRISFRTPSGKLQAVRNISFDLHKGETLAIVGESGSGKSVTARSILGILSGNAIVEGGELLYDGMDLLRLSESEFCRLRGDRISMIFQDPLSSLNPIMRIGKQLTEAMLLKSKAHRRLARAQLNERYRLLEKLGGKTLMELYLKTARQAALQQQLYTSARDMAGEALSEAGQLLRLISGHNVTNARARLHVIADRTRRSIHPYVTPESVRSRADRLEKGRSAQLRDNDLDDIAACLHLLTQELERALQTPKPELFAKAYCQVQGISESTADECCEAYLVSPLTGRLAKSISERTSLFTEKRRHAVAALREARLILTDELPDNDTLNRLSERLCTAVSATVDSLDIDRDSRTCTFSAAFKSLVRTAALGRRSVGRKPDAPATIDLDLVHADLIALVDRMLVHIGARIASDEALDAVAAATAQLDAVRNLALEMTDRMTRRRARARALRLMEEVGIPEPRKRYRDYPFQFSGGMRQRIVIAIALAADPDILICDEPTTALDVSVQAQILELINRIKKERELSVLFITHDLGVVANMADRIAVMYAGKLVEYGTAEEIFYTPAHPYTWALLSSMPDLDTREKLEAIPGTPPNMIYPPKGDAFAARNRYALAIDFEQEPPVFPITDTHWAATWLLHPDAPKLDPPKAVTDRIIAMKKRTQEGSQYV